MNHPRFCIPIVSLLLSAVSPATPLDAKRIEQTWEVAMTKWNLETRAASTPEARAQAFAKRPDATPYARDMWKLIAPSLNEPWTLEPAAWFLRATPGLLSTNEQGTPVPTFSQEIETIRRTVEARHLKSPNLIPMCMALATGNDPRSLSILEKIQAGHPDKKTQGVAALGAAMILKTLGDDAELMRKRLTYLRKAIVESSDIDLGGRTVAKLAEDELYIIRYLTKGRVAPDLTGIDSAGRPLKLSDYQGKVILLLFWGSGIQEADRVIQITAEMDRKFKGRPFAIIGVNHDPIDKLRSLEASSTVTWRNFSDPTNQLAGEYRVGSWPLVYVLDGERKIHYAGPQGSFAEATAEALLVPAKPAPGK
jgi:peroxiredoxin